MQFVKMILKLHSETRHEEHVKENENKKLILI